MKEKVFIHSSIKTRIETFLFHSSSSARGGFLYIVPLKQGLKHVELGDYIIVVK